MNTLYSRSLNGKIKVWKIYPNNNNIIIESGYIGSNTIISSRPCTFSSIQKELDSRIKAQRRNGYKSIEELNITEDSIKNTSLIYMLDIKLPKTNLDLDFNLKPNKAVKFRDREPIYPCYGQPKLNGLRGVIRSESITEGIGLFKSKLNTFTIKTMGGLEYIVPTITTNISSLKYDGVDLALDGELYIPYTPLNVIKKAIPMRLETGTITKVSRPDLIDKVKFYCFDLAIEDITQSERLRIRDLFLSTPIKNVIPVITRIINNNKEAIDFANECVSQGFEGAVFRNIHSDYKFGSRTVDLVKLKFFADSEFLIVDVISKPKTPDLGMFVCKNDINDETFTVNPMGTHEEQKLYLSNKHDYIGKMVTVKYYERSGIKNVPFHANALAFRNDGE
jgi:hypothetical protein